MKNIWLALLALILGYEIFTLTNRKRGDTLTEVVWEASDRTPLLPFCLGMVAGHWFWHRNVTLRKHKIVRESFEEIG